MKYLFILGRNIELSIAEVVSYFEKEDNKILNYVKNNNSILIEVAKKIKNNAIDSFGGVISIGEIISSGNLHDIISEIENQLLYFGEKNKFNYVLWDFSEDTLKISNCLKNIFKSEKLKAIEKKLTGSIKLQTGRYIKNVASNLINEQYFLFKNKDKNYFGRIIQKCNHKEIEKRDMEKPVRRESLSISPRLAKIMINLSQIKEGEKLVDPFCGIGVILQEALIKKIRVIGIDKDQNSIKGAKKNLEWGKFSKQYYKLINGNSKKINIKQANVIVTEPELGEILKKIPTKQKAERILRGFEKLIVSVLNNMKYKISGRIVFTAPLIRIGEKRINCDIHTILNKTKLKLVKGFPISEFRTGQIIGRDIFVCMRNL